jgi:hypothetical protein
MKLNHWGTFLLMSAPRLYRSPTKTRRGIGHALTRDQLEILRAVLNASDEHKARRAYQLRAVAIQREANRYRLGA